MDLVGRVIIDIPMEEGVSRAGNAWRKKSWIIETFGNFPKKVKIDIFGRSIDNVHLEMGKVYTLSVDAESREFNGRWYTDISCYAARETDGNMNPAGYAQHQAPVNPVQPMAPVSQPFTGGDNPFEAPGAGGNGRTFEDNSDDLPF